MFCEIISFKIHATDFVLEFSHTVALKNENNIVNSLSFSAFYVLVT